MKQLTCEMCGSIDLLKQDGVFVCQSCGTKYSIEEAKKMMVEGTVEIVGTVRIDNSGSYDKFIGLARDAFEDSRYETAYEYCSKVLDINTENLEMILLQGLSLFGKEEFGKNISVGCINAVETYIKKMSSFEWGAETVQEFETAMQYVNGVCDYKKAELDAIIAEIRIDLKPTRGAMDVLADLGRPTFVVSQNQAEDKRIELHNAQVRGKINVVQAKIDTIVKFQKETVGRMLELYTTEVEEAAKKRFSEYWAAHTEEKAALEAEKKSLADKVESMNSEMVSLPEIKVEAQLEMKIESLRKELAELGFFKGKEKKALQEQIDVLTSRDLEEAKANRVVALAPIQAQIDAACARIAEIDEELTKDR